MAARLIPGKPELAGGHTRRLPTVATLEDHTMTDLNPQAKIDAEANVQRLRHMGIHIVEPTEQDRIKMKAEQERVNALARTGQDLNPYTPPWNVPRKPPHID